MSELEEIRALANELNTNIDALATKRHVFITNGALLSFIILLALVAAVFIDSNHNANVHQCKGLNTIRTQIVTFSEGLVPPNPSPQQQQFLDQLHVKFAQEDC